MMTIFFALLAWVSSAAGLQGIPVQPTQTGTITGTLRDSQGRPASGIRVAALARPTSVDELGGGASMSSIAETDAQGRFSLENVPPGRYYVSAGRLDFPTYYPGTQAMGEGTLVTVGAGSTIPRIDFALRDTSVGRADAGAATGGTLTVPLDIRVENGGKIPMFGAGKFTALRVTAVAQQGVPTPQPSAIPFSQSFLSLSITTPEYQLEIEGLPPEYTVRSMKYGSTNITGGRLVILPGVYTNPNGTTVSTSQAAMAAYLNALSVGAGVQGTVQSLSVLLNRTVPPAGRPGVTVTGALKTLEPRGLFISGVSGALFTDGTFEFRDVLAGRHSIVATSSRPGAATLGASIIVGPRDMTGVELEETAVPPLDFKTPSDAGLPSTLPVGRRPLAAVRGRVVDAETSEPVTGSIFLVGDTWTEFALSPTGSFEFSKVLPGRYEFEVHGAGYTTFRRGVLVADQDLTVELKSN